MKIKQGPEAFVRAGFSLEMSNTGHLVQRKEMIFVVGRLMPPPAKMSMS